jgi:transcriptional regulator with XRE-family HTH domain
MQLSSTKFKKRCALRRISLGDVLKQAGVSRTAYYSLIRKKSVLPKSILRIASHLDINPAALLDNDDAKIKQIRGLQAKATVISSKYPECDRDVIFRTLQNLKKPPVERLRRALIRARQPAIHK